MFPRTQGGCEMNSAVAVQIWLPLVSRREEASSFLSGGSLPFLLSS